jgi:hypothetical protein
MMIAEETGKEDGSSVLERLGVFASPGFAE